MHLVYHVRVNYPQYGVKPGVAYKCTSPGWRGLMSFMTSSRLLLAILPVLSIARPFPLGNLDVGANSTAK